MANCMPMANALLTLNEIGQRAPMDAMHEFEKRRATMPVQDDLDAILGKIYDLRMNRGDPQMTNLLVLYKAKTGKDWPAFLG